MAELTIEEKKHQKIITSIWEYAAYYSLDGISEVLESFLTKGPWFQVHLTNNENHQKLMMISLLEGMIESGHYDQLPKGIEVFKKKLQLSTRKLLGLIK